MTHDSRIADISAVDGVGDTAIELNPEDALSFWTPERRRLALIASAAGPASASPLFNSVRIPDPSDERWRQVVLLYTVIDGRPQTASGVVVEADLVLTAGHALHALSHWATTAIVMPAYDMGSSPFGEWPARMCYAPAAWTRHELRQFDVGLVRVAPTRDGITLGQIVGARRVAASSNPPPRGFSRDWIGVGYPGSPGGGEQMYGESLSSLFAQPRDPRGSVVAADSDFTAGCSGGPWLTNLGGQTVVNGLYTHSDPTRPGVQFGPYFGPDLKAWLSTRLRVLDMPDSQTSSDATRPSHISPVQEKHHD